MEERHALHNAIFLLKDSKWLVQVVANGSFIRRITLQMEMASLRSLNVVKITSRKYDIEV